MDLDDEDMMSEKDAFEIQTEVLTRDQAEQLIKSKIQPFDFRLDDPFVWFKKFESIVAQFCKEDGYQESDLFYYLPCLLPEEEEVWFYTQKNQTGNDDWSTFKRMFCKHFRDEKRKSLKDALHTTFNAEGDMYDFCKAKLAKLNSHFPNVDCAEKIEMTLACLPDDSYAELSSSADFGQDRFLRVVQGICKRNPTEKELEYEEENEELTDQAAPEISVNIQAEIDKKIAASLTKIKDDAAQQIAKTSVELTLKITGLQNQIDALKKIVNS